MRISEFSGLCVGILKTEKAVREAAAATLELEAIKIIKFHTLMLRNLLTLSKTLDDSDICFRQY